MSAGKHTPAPWSVLSNGHCVVGPAVRPSNEPQSAGVAMCGMNLRSREEFEANARLIAAAPDLLAALTDVLGWVPGPAAWHTDAPMKSVERARAAIAKALGEAA